MAKDQRSGARNDVFNASDPGRLQLSHAKLKRLRPDLYGIRGLIRRMLTVVPEKTFVERQLKDGDSRAAVVVKTSPLLVAAYTDELDCIAMLRFSDDFVQEYDLVVGSRLLTINFYGQTPDYQPDLIPGPNRYHRHNYFHPLIAEFLSDDLQRIETRKRQIRESEWEWAHRFGMAYLIAKPGMARDGSPVYAAIAATDPASDSE